MGSMRQFVLAVLVAVSSAFSPACSSDDNSSVRIAQPFAEVHGDVLTLHRNMLGQPLLLSPTIILAAPMPQVMPMRPKIVAFELHGSTVALVERHGLAVYDTLPNARLLDTFALRGSDADTVTFAWGQGLHVVPMGSPTAASDFPGSLEEGIAASDPAVPVVSTIVTDSYVDGDALELVQVSRLRMQEQDHSAELHVRFAPYTPSTTFQPLPSPNAEGLGFFEVATLQPKSGSIVAAAARWDVGPEKGPIKYLIAADTPVEVRQVIAEGILYWNRVAGREIVKVGMAAQGQVVAKPHQVVVHWIPWSQAGFASSALQPDPLTGEILAGDIYLTSFWIDVAEDFVDQRALSTLLPAPVTPSVPVAPVDPMAPAEPVSVAPTFAPVGFSPARICGWGDSQALKRWRAEATATLPDPLLPRALDHLRAVVAHESGHTLGLRHNFAASLGSELRTPAAVQTAWEHYLAGDGGARTSDSVMDYTTMADTMMQGAILPTQVLPYDVAAIQYGYGDALAQQQGLQSAAQGTFCTDMEAQVGVVLGCQLDDSGPEPLTGYRAALADHARMGTSLLSTWLKLGWGRPDLSAEQAAGLLNPLSALGMQMRPAMEAFKQLQRGAQVLKIDRALGGRNWLNAKTYRDATLNAQRDALQAVGGVPGLLAAGVRLDEGGGIKAGFVGELLDERLGAWQRSFLLPSEADALRVAMPPVAEQLEDLYLLVLFSALTGGLTAEEGLQADRGYAEGLADDSWEAALNAMAASVILAESGETQGMVDGEAITVAAPRYSLRTRLAATRVYSATVFQSPGWMKASRQRLMDTIKERAEAVAGETQAPRGLAALMPGFSSMPSLAGRAASLELRQWMDESVMLLKALDRAGG